MFTDILSVSPTFGSNQGGTKISIAVNSGPLTDYPREDIKVYVGGKGIYSRPEQLNNVYYTMTHNEIPVIVHQSNLTPCTLSYCMYEIVDVVDPKCQNYWSLYSVLHLYNCYYSVIVTSFMYRSAV